MGQRADVGHVRQIVLQLALHARIANEFVDRHGVVGHVVALGNGAPIGVVEADAARRQCLDVLDDRGLIEGHQYLRRVAAGGVAVLAQPDVVPRRQALDIRREDVLAVDGDAHLEQRAQDSHVGRLAAGAVGRGDDDGKVVDDGSIIDDQTIGRVALLRRRRLFNHSVTHVHFSFATTIGRARVGRARRLPDLSSVAAKEGRGGGETR